MNSRELIWMSKSWQILIGLVVVVLFAGLIPLHDHTLGPDQDHDDCSICLGLAQGATIPDSFTIAPGSTSYVRLPEPGSPTPTVSVGDRHPPRAPPLLPG
jgi:hypothetical protein